VAERIQYPRTAAWRHGDFEAARRFEEEVGEWLGAYKIGNLDSTERMDWWVPGVYIDVKEKRQPISSKWPLPDDCGVEDAFILDELSIRRAMEKHPHAYFVMHDAPTGRVFLARVDEVACADRVRVDRVGSTGHAKGKWVLDLRQFRHLPDPPADLLVQVLSDQVALPWRQSSLLIGDRND
jgi:hypothetical protein